MGLNQSEDKITPLCVRSHANEVTLRNMGKIDKYQTTTITIKRLQYRAHFLTGINLNPSVDWLMHPSLNVE